VAKGEIKKPKQKRSIETKKQILQAGFQMITEKGYHNTDTNEIAKAAGVSTGIVYRYFPDKKAILMELIENFFGRLEKLDYLDMDILHANDLHTFIENMLERFVALHRNYAAAHEEIEALRRSDADVGELYRRIEDTIIREIMDELVKLGISGDHLEEKLRLIEQLLEGYCHMVGIEGRERLDHDFMRKTVIESAIQIIS